MRHLLMNLEAPLMAFGGETIDNYGVTRRFPAVSMLTGLLANALGWRRIERERHQRLQDRLVFAARIDREPAGGARLTDFQTAQLGKDDEGWTTRGKPEGRAGGANTYQAPHLRYRDYFADMRVTVALRLNPDDESPTLEDLALALDEPARPLFIGRGPCLPSGPVFVDFTDAETTLAALLSWPLESWNDALSKAPGRRTEAERGAPVRVSLLWPDGEQVQSIPASWDYMLTDQRNWVSGLHGGGRRVFEGAVPHDRFPAREERP